MSDLLRPDEDLLQRLPLPLAQLCRRAHNAKADLERHQAAFYLWEAALKLLGAACVVEYARLGEGEGDAELDACLHNLARPALGHWWEFVRRLTPRLADRGVAGFGSLRDLLTGRRDDLPRTAGLDAALRHTLEGAEPAARASVAVAELFDRLVQYRNAEIGHGAAGQRPGDFYGRMGRALLAGATEFFGRLDVLAGRRLLFAADVRQVRGIWRVERFELVGESPRRLEPLDLPREQTDALPDGDRVYLEEADGALTALHPLVVYDAEANECALLNARRGSTRADFLCYSSGRMLMRPDLGGEQRALLARALRLERISAEQAEAWAALSQADEPADTADGSATPRTLGEYELLSELGRGGMGVVYRARQPALGRQVALKCLLRPGDPKAEARFRREIRALGRVDHPHLMKVFASGADGDQWFYVMELVEGASLAAICDKLTAGVATAIDLPAWQAAVSTAADEQRTGEKPISSGAPTGPVTEPREAAPVTAPATTTPKHGDRAYIDCVVSLVRQAAEAAEALHRHGVVHRDVKPGNILVDATGTRATLMDLGLAQLADDVEGRLTRTRQFVGTLRYASPEQVLAVAPVDRRGDVYGLGATLWELLALRPLFGATEATPTPELMQTIQREEPQRLRSCHRGVSRDLEAVVHKCLEKKPTDRYATAQDLADDLARYLAGEPVRARRVRGVERTWKWVRRRPVLAGLLTAVVLVTVAGINSFAWAYGKAVREATNATAALGEAREANRRRVRALVEQLATGPAATVPSLLEALGTERVEALPQLRELHAGGGEAKTRYALALLPDEPALRDELLAALLAADDPREMLLAREALLPFSAELTNGLWRQADDLDASVERRFRALAALAAFDATNPKWQAAAPTVANKLLTTNPLQAAAWVEAFRPVRGALLGPLKDVFTTAHLAERRPAAAAVLAVYNADDPTVLADLAGRTEQLAVLGPLLELHRATALALLRKELTTRFKSDDLAGARRQAGAAAALLVLGEADDVWPLLRATPTPDVRTYLIRDLAPMGVDYRTVHRRLREEKDASIRRALILALGEYSDEQLPADARAALAPLLLGWYRDDPDAGVHGALDWLLRHKMEGPVPRKIDWNQGVALAQIDTDMRGKPPVGDRCWFVSASGRTFSLVKGPVDAQLGEKSSRPAADETPRREQIPRSFAVAAQTVTVAEYDEFLQSKPPGVQRAHLEQYGPDRACPVTGVSWYEAAIYCRWLGEREGLAEEQQCYPKMAEIARSASLAQDYNGGGVPAAVGLALGCGAEYWRREAVVLHLPADCLQRTGYRLATEAEWEYACRAGTATPWGHGADEAGLARYAWSFQNSQGRRWTVGQKRPNERGLFDMHGNVWQWCLDEYRQRPEGGDADEVLIKDINSCVLRGGSFNVAPSYVRSSFHYYDRPASRSSYIGLRVARTYR